jgi:hypothetical protein
MLQVPRALGPVKGIAQRGYDLFGREFSIEGIMTDVVPIVQEFYETQGTATFPPVGVS